MGCREGSRGVPVDTSGCTHWFLVGRGQYSTLAGRPPPPTHTQAAPFIGPPESPQGGPEVTQTPKFRGSENGTVGISATKGSANIIGVSVMKKNWPFCDPQHSKN